MLDVTGDDSEAAVRDLVRKDGLFLYGAGARGLLNLASGGHLIFGRPTAARQSVGVAWLPDASSKQVLQTYGPQHQDQRRVMVDGSADGQAASPLRTAPRTTDIQAQGHSAGPLWQGALQGLWQSGCQ